MLHHQGVTARVARFIAQTQWSDMPPEVIHQAKRSFMNFFAVALAGSRTEPIEIAFR
jgi:2-methylcitrate dehydratase PrpD